MFAKIPYQLFDDLRDGKIDRDMFDILCWLHRRADWRTGVASRVSAKLIRNEMFATCDADKEPLSLRAIQRKLKRLRLMGYIRSHHLPGQKMRYRVTINNFAVAGSDGEETILNPSETKGLEDLFWLSDADTDADLNGDLDGELNGDLDGDLSANTRDSRETEASGTTEASGDLKERKEEVMEPLAPLASSGGAASPSAKMAADQDRRGNPDGQQRVEAGERNPLSRIPTSTPPPVPVSDETQRFALGAWWLLHPHKGPESLPDEFAACLKVTALLDSRRIDPDSLLAFNKRHMKDSLVIRDFHAFLKAAEGSLLDRWSTHDPKECPKCQRAKDTEEIAPCESCDVIWVKPSVTTECLWCRRTGWEPAGKIGPSPAVEEPLEELKSGAAGGQP